jgi:type IV secretory pathway component VirB8
VEVIAFTEPNNVVMLMNIKTTLPFEVTVKNNDANIDIEKETGMDKIHSI